MLTTDTLPPARVDRPSIVRQIDRRTGGRLRDLRIENRGGRLWIAGSAPSYYIKQLALAAILDVLGSVDPAQVELAIQVTEGGGRWLRDDLEPIRD